MQLSLPNTQQRLQVVSFPVFLSPSLACCWKVDPVFRFVQVGCVLGHGGTVVAQVRALTGCQVHVFGGNDRGPMPAPADAEQVVQMEGMHMQCLMAVRQVGSLLRGWQVGGALLGVVHCCQ